MMMVTAMMKKIYPSPSLMYELHVSEWPRGESQLRRRAWVSDLLGNLR
jgi:hypothetical protein